MAKHKRKIELVEIKDHEVGEADLLDGHGAQVGYLRYQDLANLEHLLFDIPPQVWGEGRIQAAQPNQDPAAVDENWNFRWAAAEAQPAQNFNWANAFDPLNG